MCVPSVTFMPSSYRSYLKTCVRPNLAKKFLACALRHAAGLHNAAAFQAAVLATVAAQRDAQPPVVPPMGPSAAYPVRMPVPPRTAPPAFASAALNDAAGAAITTALPRLTDKQEMKTLCDAVQRCITSARHAQRLSAMAANAFNDEAAVFEDVKAALEAKMSLL